MEQYRDTHEGDRVFILGTGPSINETPLEELKQEYTISMNKISLIYNETSWRPTYYVFYDAAHYLNRKIPEHRMENVKKSVQQGIESFISRPAKEYFGDRENINYFDYDHSDIIKKRKHAIQVGDASEIWSKDIGEKIYNFGSTISVATQIADYMGFDQIYFLGCDLYEPTGLPHSIFVDHNHPKDYNFKSSNKKSKKIYNYLKDSNFSVKSLVNLGYYEMVFKQYKKARDRLPNRFKSDKNHFSDEYLPDKSYNAREMNKSMSEVHKVIKLASDQYEFEVYNATPGGYLEVYERVDLHDLI